MRVAAFRCLGLTLLVLGLAANAGCRPARETATPPPGAATPFAQSAVPGAPPGPSWAQGWAIAEGTPTLSITEGAITSADNPGEYWSCPGPPDGSILTVGFGPVWLEGLLCGETAEMVRSAVTITGPAAGEATIDTKYLNSLHVDWPSAGPGASGSVTVAIDAGKLKEFAGLAGSDGIYALILRRDASPTVAVRSLDDPFVALPYSGERDSYNVANGRPHRFQFLFSDPMDRPVTEAALLYNIFTTASGAAWYRFDWTDDRTLTVTLLPSSAQLLHIGVAGARDALGRTLWDTRILRVRWNTQQEVVQFAPASGGATGSGPVRVCVCPPGVDPVSVSPDRRWVLGLEELYDARSLYHAWLGNLTTGEWRIITVERRVISAAFAADSKVVLAGLRDWRLFDPATGKTTEVQPASLVGDDLVGVPAVHGDLVALAVGGAWVGDRQGVDIVVCGLDGSEKTAFPGITWRLVHEQVPVEWTPDGRALALVRCDDTGAMSVARLDLETGVVTNLYRSGYFVILEVYGAEPGSEYVALLELGLKLRPLQVFDLGSGELKFTIGVPPVTGGNGCRVVADPGGDVLAVWASGSEGFYDARTGRPLGIRVPGPPLSWTPDGLWLYLPHRGKG